MRKTLYDLLELSRNASAEAVEASYHRLQQKLQSQADAGNEDARVQLKAIREAYQTLADATRRGVYDASLSAAASTVTQRPSTAYAGDDHDREVARSRRNLVIGAIVVAAVLYVGYRLVADHQAKVELARIEKLQAIEREKLEIERRKAEAAEAAEAQRLEMQKQREDAALARQRAYDDLQWRTRASQERAVYERQKVSDERQQEAAERRRQREEQMARDRQRIEAERRLREDKELLRRMCLERYGRPDC